MANPSRRFISPGTFGRLTRAGIVSLLVTPPCTSLADGRNAEDPLADLKLPTMLADASDALQAQQDAAAGEEMPDNYETCAKFRADPDVRSS